ncbi:hypothetical protein [Streptomyces humi]
MLRMQLSVLLAGLLSEPANPDVREALYSMTPSALEALASEALTVTEEKWRKVVVEQVRAFAAEQPGDGRPVVAAYFTATEQRDEEGPFITWSPFIAALSPTEEVPDLRHTATTATLVPVNEAAEVKEHFADPELVQALDALAALDPPAHEDILRVHLPTRTVSRATPDR